MDAPEKKRRLKLPDLGAKLRRPNLPKWLRAWPIYVLAAGVVGGTVYMVRHRPAGSVDAILPPTVSLEQNIEIQFGDVIMQGREKGVQRWVITSPKVSLSRDGRFTYFEPEPTGRFYNLKDWEASEEAPNDKTRSFTWKANKAQFDAFSEDLTIEGSAVMTTDTQDTLKTEKVEYKSGQKRVFMPEPVAITTKDGSTIKADALEANVDAEVMELKGRVDLVTPVNEEVKL